MWKNEQAQEFVVIYRIQQQAVREARAVRGKSQIPVD
jgi:hypothetical protein